MTPSPDKLAIPEAAVEAAALIQLAHFNIPTDVQELLVQGDPARSIPPRALRSALAAALPHMPDRGYAEVVKPLEWRACDTFPAPTWMASTPFGFYEIEERAGSDVPSYAVEWHSFTVITIEDSLDDAKAAAQRDYQTRIRSAAAGEPAAPNETDLENARLEAYEVEAENKLAALAMSDNHVLERKSYDDAWAVWKKLADHGYLSVGAADTGPQGYQGSVIEIIRAALSATPSPTDNGEPDLSEAHRIITKFRPYVSKAPRGSAPRSRS